MIAELKIGDTIAYRTGNEQGKIADIKIIRDETIIALDNGDEINSKDWKIKITRVKLS